MTGPAALTERGRRTRERIVSAAADLLFTQGVAATTHEDVRAAAAVSGSQLAHYFRDRDALVRAVVDHQHERIVGEEELFWARVLTLAQVRAWRDRIVAGEGEVGCRGGCALGALGAQLAEADDDARRRVAAGFTRWQAAIAGGLRNVQRGGEIDPDTEPDGLAAALLAALQGGLLLSQVQRDTTPLAAALDGVLHRLGRNAI